MIPQITEINFPSYATLHQATVTITAMGERTITTQVRIDGDIAPEFGVTEGGVFKPMELEFRGERYILPIREPQAKKDNTTRNSLIDLTFYSWPVYELKRYFFVEMASINSGTAIADQYNASLTLNLRDFVGAFNLVLEHYFGNKIRMVLHDSWQGGDPVMFEINYTKIWDVLTKINELYDIRWWVDWDASTGTYLIKVGYPAAEMDDHNFTYGYRGGLLSFERAVQSDDMVNVLLGRGGEKNLPYRYFKRVDEQNPSWAADPDAIPELEYIYFDRLHDINFRWYVRGWMTNPRRDRSWENAGYVYPTYDVGSIPERQRFAYLKGATDEKFNPVEYVKDDDSIAKYGEFWGALDNNDDIFPTIQGVTVYPYGRIDEAVAISAIETDDIAAYAAGAAVETTVQDMRISLQGDTQTSYTVWGDRITIPEGNVGNITYRPLSKDDLMPNFVYYDTSRSSLKAISTANNREYAVNGLPAGTYQLKLNLVIRIDNPATTATGTFGVENVVVSTSAADTNAWKPTFDIWVKNIWQTTKGANESDQDYSERVWLPILGDHLGNEAKIVFSTGAMSISQDYEFVIASLPVHDETRTINGVKSQWRITVYKCDAEYQATGLYIPNASAAQPVAGDKFFFIGIDMPHYYVLLAEDALNQYKDGKLPEMSEIQPTWNLKLDKVRIHTLEDEDYGQRLVDRLDAGVLINTSDPRFTSGTLSLYIQTITFTWNEPSQGSPYIVPDVDVVLSDKPMAIGGTISRIENDVDIISRSYVNANDVENAVRRVAGSLYLKKTGESDTSSSPTTFSSKVSSRGFRKGGVGGTGWGFYEDNSRMFSAASPATRSGVSSEENQNRSVLEVDRLVVREEMEVNSLVVNQITYRGGCEIISAASIEVSLVRETDTAYVCYFDQKQNSVVNLFHVNDIAYGQVWNPDNSSLRFYKMLVSGINRNSITLLKAGKYGEGVPQEGDVIVQYGSLTDPARQYVILRDVVGGGHDRMLSGLDSVSATGVEYYFAGIESGDTPRWFVGDHNGEYAEWYDGHLNIKGQLTVLKSDGSYQALSEYINQINLNEQNLQAQIDGQVQSWSGDVAPLPIEEEGTVDPSTANYPASDWTDVTTRLKHMGDIYVDNTSGQGYRYTRQANDGEFYWMRLSDEEVALALERANQALSGVAGLEYLRAATNEGTLVEGGLVLTSLIQLGQTEGGVYNVYSGISGIMRPSDMGGGIAAWYGGPMTDHEADPASLTYANSLFRFDGSGYLAGGLLRWGVDNGQAFLTLNGEAVVGGTGGTSLNDIANLMFDVIQYSPGHYAAKLRGRAYYGNQLVALDGLAADGWISGGGVSSGGGGGGGGASRLSELTDVDSNLNPQPGQVLMYDDSLGKWTSADNVSGSAIFYGVCETAAGVATKVVACPTFTTADLARGVMIAVKMINAEDHQNVSTGNNFISLNINGTGSRYVVPYAVPNYTSWRAGETVLFVYSYYRTSSNCWQIIPTAGYLYNHTRAVWGNTDGDTVKLTVGTTEKTLLLSSYSPDLSGYVTTSDLNTKLADYATVESLSSYVTTTVLSDTLANYATTGAMNTALQGYLPLTAGATKPLTGTLSINPANDNDMAIKIVACEGNNQNKHAILFTDTVDGDTIYARIGSGAGSGSGTSRVRAYLQLMAEGGIYLRVNNSTSYGVSITSSDITYNNRSLLYRQHYFNETAVTGSGVFIKTDIAANANHYPYFHITGIYRAGSQSAPIDTYVSFHCNHSGNAIQRATAVHNGYNLGTIYAFVYDTSSSPSPTGADGRVGLWFERPSRYSTISVYGRTAFSSVIGGNIVTDLTYAAKPSGSNIARDTAITRAGHDTLQPLDNTTQDIGAPGKYWRDTYTKKIYLADNVYIEYDSDNNCVRVHGAGFASDSFISAGGISNT